MRKKVKLALSAFFLIFLAVLAFQFYKTYQTKKLKGLEMVILPKFSLLDTNGKTLTNKDISTDEWTVFVFFNSECSYCQEEALQLKELKGKLDDVQFLWVSSEPSSSITDFQNLYGLVDHPGISFLHDLNAVFSKKCDVTNIPHFLVYDATGTLVKNHKGAWRIDRLLDHIDNEFKTH